MFDLDIIIPCYNPRSDWLQNFRESVIEIKNTRPDLRISFILVDDGSDNLIEIDENCLREFDIRIVRNAKNLGKGAAIRRGFSESHSSFKIFTDYDFPYRHTDLFKLYDQIKSGVNIAVGVRVKTYNNDVNVLRRILSRFSQLMNKYILRIPIQDTQAGLKAFDKTGADLLMNTKISGFLFDLELIRKAVSDDSISIVSVPVELKDNIELSNFKIKVLFDEFINLLKILSRTN